MAPWWNDRLPPETHPAWRIAQGVLAVIGLALVVVHGLSGLHAGGIDTADAAGAAGVVVAMRLILKGLS